MMDGGVIVTSVMGCVDWLKRDKRCFTARTTVTAVGCARVVLSNVV